MPWMWQKTKQKTKELPDNQLKPQVVLWGAMPVACGISQTGDETLCHIRDLSCSSDNAGSLTSEQGQGSNLQPHGS